MYGTFKSSRVFGCITRFLIEKCEERSGHLVAAGAVVLPTSSLALTSIASESAKHLLKNIVKSMVRLDLHQRGEGASAFPRKALLVMDLHRLVVHMLIPAVIEIDLLLRRVAPVLAMSRRATVLE